MPPQQSQPNPNSPENIQSMLQQGNQTATALGFANSLLKQGMPQDAPPTPNPDQGVPTNQTNQEDTKAQIEGLETRLMDELNTLKAEMKDAKDGQSQFNDLKKQIEAVLNSND